MTKKLTPKTKVLGASQNRGAILVQNNVAIIFLSSTPKIALVILYLSNGRTRHTIPNVRSDVQLQRLVSKRLIPSLFSNRDSL